MQSSDPVIAPQSTTNEPPPATQAATTGETMKALVFRGSRDVRYEEVPKPAVTNPKDAVIRITCTCICGSDLHCYNNEVPAVKKGQVLGHESMGIVDSVGPEVQDLKVGDRVVVAFDIACGTCSHCKKQQFSGCEITNPSKEMKGIYGHTMAGVYGFGNMTGGYSGGQAEFIRVPFADVNCLKVPDSLPDEKALYLSDIACTSYHAAIQLGAVKEGEDVAIWGAGPIGMLTAQWCALARARNIYVIDNVPARLQMVKDKVPSVTTIDFDKVDTSKALESMCPEGVDVSIECAGFRYAKSKFHALMRATMLETDSPELVNEAIKATKLYGRIVLIADYLGFTNGFNIGGLMEKHLFLSGGQCPVQAVWHKVLGHIMDGSFDPTYCVTTHAKLSDGPALYEQFNMKQIVKTFLRPESFTGAPAESTVHPATLAPSSSAVPVQH